MTYLGLCSNHEFLIVHLTLHSKNVLGPANKRGNLPACTRLLCVDKAMRNLNNYKNL